MRKRPSNSIHLTLGLLRLENCLPPKKSLKIFVEYWFHFWLRVLLMWAFIPFPLQYVPALIWTVFCSRPWQCLNNAVQSLTSHVTDHRHQISKIYAYGGCYHAPKKAPNSNSEWRKAWFTKLMWFCFFSPQVSLPPGGKTIHSSHVPKMLLGKLY